MKQLSEDVVGTVGNFLMLSFGSTTTLDVKNICRRLGFKANQDEVSKLMNNIVEDYKNSSFYPYLYDGKEYTWGFEVKHDEKGKSFRLYSFKECEDKPLLKQDSVIHDSPRDYILKNMNESSILISRKLGIPEGSVRAYKANITRGN